MTAPRGNLMPALFTAAAVALCGWYNVSRPSILILHSYDPAYAWTRDVNIGLGRVLKQRYLYQLRWHYMDSKRHPAEPDKLRAGRAARDMIEASRPDVIIAIDDDAQHYVARHYANDNRFKIVFAGVNRDLADYGYERANNVTGILERMPLAAVREALLGAGNFAGLGRPIRLGFLGDRSDSVSGDAKQVRRFDWQPVRLTAPRQVGTWPEWQADVLARGAGEDALLVAGYRHLRRSASDPSLVPPEEIVTWTEAHAPLPLISCDIFYTEDGGMLAIGTSPYEQGEVAAARALDILLRHRPLATLPMTLSHQFIVSMRGARMQARHFVLPRVYEAAARTGNQYYP
ncbi:MAG: hypothetical protein V4754_21515 [Pseudomonadota bacterium]